jgi:hypothetical protein
MTSPIEKATQHFRTKISGEMRSVYVPEWETKIYYKASNTLKEQAKLIELANQGKTVEALVEQLIIKSRNEDGTKMFAMPDKMTFMNEVDPQVIIRVVAEMNTQQEEDFDKEAVEKN